jgi:predicted AlkP superfamily phosphohydrolase/phosphomutase
VPSLIIDLVPNVVQSSERPSERRRVLLIGLDGVPPDFLFEGMRSVMPNVHQLISTSLRAPLRTTDPPVSVPAWPVMFTGVDPGTLGIYGFRHRKAGTYSTMYVPGSRDLPVPALWEILSARGLRVAVVGMPLGYPPPPVNGVYISDFLTPGAVDDWVHPATLKDEIERRFGPYPFDVVFRSSERDHLFEELLKMTRTRFDVAEWLLQQEAWDLFAIHEIGTDRLHHAYWKYFDRNHPKYEPGNRFENAHIEYYTALDAAIGKLLRHVDERTYVLIVSDHGSMSMNGCFCVNEWLERQGYVVLKRPPAAPGTPFGKVEVDWHRTTAWGEGGYYARIFFNVRGREPQGVVPIAQLATLRRQLSHELQAIEGPDGQLLGAQILDPREIYQTVRGDAPDLIVYLGDLKWRSAGSMGHPGLFLEENDIGPDDAVHSFEGVFLLHDPQHPVERTAQQFQIRDVTPTILDLLGIHPPAHIQGSVIPGVRVERIAPLVPAVGGMTVGGVQP